MGPYDAINYKRIFLNKVSNIKFFKKFFNYFPNFDIYSFKRDYKPLRIFLSAEDIDDNLPKYDYSFNHDLGIINDNPFRFPIWERPH